MARRFLPVLHLAVCGRRRTTDTMNGISVCNRILKSVY